MRPRLIKINLVYIFRFSRFDEKIFMENINFFLCLYCLLMLRMHEIFLR